MLIRDIAYTKGALMALDRSLNKTKGEIKAMGQQYQQFRAEKRELQARMVVLERELQARTTDIDTEEVRGIRRVPKTYGQPHGTIMATIVSALKAVDGPVDTHTLVNIVLAELGIPASTPAEYAYARKSIRRKLCLLVEKGAVERLPDAPAECRSISRQAVGVWRWKGL